MNTIPNIHHPLSDRARSVFEEREGRPLFLADWQPVCFVHFAVPPRLLQREVPFPLDLHEGKAFVSLVAFSLSNFRVPGLGRLGTLLLDPFLASRFLNVRTYVRGPAGPGIFFLREYLSNALSVPLGRPVFGLPYQRGNLQYETEPERNGFRMKTFLEGSKFNLSAVPRAPGHLPAEEGSLTEFLLERYIAYTGERQRARFFRIWHQPWLQVECDLNIDDPLPATFGPWHQDATLVCAHVSPGVQDVWLGRPRQVAQPRSVKSGRRPLTADIFISSNPGRVWEYSQDTQRHKRWDIRFTEINRVENLSAQMSHSFKYASRIGFGLAIEGWGKSVPLPNQTGSALRFGSDDPKSLILEGSGSWRYATAEGGTNFSTTYNYTTRFGATGRFFDRLVFRPLMQWGTRWSFDRLRLWIERETPPELAIKLWALKLAARWALGLVWILEGLVPKILFVHPKELAVIEESGLFWSSPEGTLFLLGLVQIGAGILLLSGWKERWGALGSTIAILALTFLVGQNDPMVLTDPYGGLIKNLGLILCAIVIWFLEPEVPKANRAANTQCKPAK